MENLSERGHEIKIINAKTWCSNIILENIFSKTSIFHVKQKIISTKGTSRMLTF